MSVHCPQCAAENLDTAQLCFSCGAPIDGGAADQLVGTVMFDSYRVIKVLGAGGMAVVYLGQNQLTGQEVAIKMLPPELAAYAEVKTRFLEEARTLAKLEHPNIVHLINFTEDQGRLCLVMQYAEGETFEELIERRGRIEPAEALQICAQVLEGLGHAHKNQVVHRDIKPSNIIVRPDGSVKVTDFGIAKITRDNKLTQTGQTMGTVRYMAPEQVRGKNIDERSDLYALGISLYEALTGDPPFDGESQFEVMQMHLGTEPKPPRDAGAPISAELEAVILKSIAKPQEERYQTAAEFRKALKATPEGRAVPRSTVEMEAAGTAPTTAAPVLDTAAPERPRSRGWLLAVVLGVVVLVAGGVTLYVVKRGGGKGGGDGSSGQVTEPGSMAPRRRPPRPARLPARHAVLDALGKLLVKWPVASLHPGPPPLFVYADRSLDAARVARGYHQSLTEYQQLLTDHSIRYPLEVRPLTLVLLTYAHLNDKGAWASVPAKAEGPDYYVPARNDSLLFVVHDKPYSERQIRYSVALHFCPLKVSNERCLELARKFEKNEKVDFLP